MFSLKPKNDFFFIQFRNAAINCHKAALALDDLINNYENVSEKISIIEELEHQGDSIVHETVTNLKKCFITPIDKEDIYILTNKLDNVVDRIQAVAFRLDMLNIEKISETSKILSNKIVECTEKFVVLIAELEKLKHSDKLKQAIIDINTIENDADDVFRSSVRELFRSDIKDIEKMKSKEIYALLEKTIDTCKDVGEKVEEVTMKHA